MPKQTSTTTAIEASRPLTIVIDTREQEPYAWDDVATVRRALPAGDYSVHGLEESIAVERKSLADFVSTVIQGRARFRGELKRLTSYRFACVVVEASMRDVLTGAYTSAAHPASVFGSLVSICVDWGVPVYCCGDRACAREFVRSWLEKAAAAWEREVGRGY